jgi:Na+/proline symporter
VLRLLCCWSPKQQTLAAASVDSNSLLGNVDLSYKFHFYDGAVIPIGLGLSLFLNSFTLAGKINREGQLGCLTLPDVLARRYGKIHEVICSCTTIASFIMLLAGNLVGIGIIQAYVWKISVSASIWLAAIIVWVSVMCCVSVCCVCLCVCGLLSV